MPRSTPIVVQLLVAALFVVALCSAQDPTDAPPTPSPSNNTNGNTTEPPSPTEEKTRWEKFEDWWDTERIIIVAVCVPVGIAILVTVLFCALKKTPVVVGARYIDEDTGKWAELAPPIPPTICATVPQEDLQRQKQEAKSSQEASAQRAAAAAAMTPNQAANTTPQQQPIQPAADPAAQQLAPGQVPPPAGAAQPPQNGGAPAPVAGQPGAALSNPFTAQDGQPLAQIISANIQRGSPETAARSLEKLNLAVGPPTGGEPTQRPAYTDIDGRNKTILQNTLDIAGLVMDGAVQQYLSQAYPAQIQPTTEIITPALTAILENPAVVQFTDETRAHFKEGCVTRTFLILRALNDMVVGAAAYDIRKKLWFTWNHPSVFVDQSILATVFNEPKQAGEPIDGKVRIVFDVTSTSVVADAVASDLKEVQKTPIFTVRWLLDFTIDTASAGPECVIAAGTRIVNVVVAPQPPRDQDDPSVSSTWNARVDELRGQIEQVYGVGNVPVDINQ